MRWVKQDGDEELEGAIKLALGNEDGAIRLLDTVLEHVDPNLVRWHTCGKGGAIHMAIRRSMTLGWSDRLGDVLTALVKRGATAWEPCDNHDGGVFREAHSTTMAWVVSGVLREEWWGKKAMSLLLDAGHPWGELDLLDNEVGSLVRAHPAWRRKQLSEQHKGNTDGLPKPKM